MSETMKKGATVAQDAKATQASGASQASAGTKPLLEVKDLSKRFPLKHGVIDAILRKPKRYVSAVSDVSLSLNEGETLGLVGESGCGKSTLARTIIQLYKPSEGSVVFAGTELTGLQKKELRESARNIQMIFQDPYSSLNPRMTVRTMLREELLHHKMCSKAEVNARIEELLTLVGLSPEHADRLPSAFSGGQRQRIGIARALAVKPKLIIADEPVSALDVSIQAQIINLLSDLQEQRGLTYLFISHDLSVVEYLSDAVGVMYLGGLVEYGLTKDIYHNPLHPYTKALLSAVPVPDPNANRNRIVLEGSLPSPANPPKGCKFHTRCPFATERCRQEVPQQKEIEKGHYVVCHLFDE